MTKIHILHENDEWTAPLCAALDELGLPYEAWFLDQGELDLATAPPAGVFYNRMSASSHTRDHRYAAELTAGVLAWLAGHGRRVVNGPPALDLEISKARQYAALEAAGIRTPRTVLVAGSNRRAAAAREHFAGEPVILKPNRGGKGLGVRLFHTDAALADYLEGPDYEPPVDGLQLLLLPAATLASGLAALFPQGQFVPHADNAWLRAHLCADPSGLRPTGVRVHIGGEDAWRDLDDWPRSPATGSWFPTPDGHLTREAPTNSAPLTSFRYDPADPTPSLGGPLLSRTAGPRDNSALEARDDVLTFTGPPLAEPVDILGPVSARLSISTDTGYADDSLRYTIKVPTNVELAPNLKGKLLLVHGDMDNNVHPGNTIRLVNALIKANKRFDFMLLPGKAHGFADYQPYFNRMLMEYFAEHLLGDNYRRSADIR